MLLLAPNKSLTKELLMISFSRYDTRETIHWILDFRIHWVPGMQIIIAFWYRSRVTLTRRQVNNTPITFASHCYKQKYHFYANAKLYITLVTRMLPFQFSVEVIKRLLIWAVTHGLRPATNSNSTIRWVSIDPVLNSYSRHLYFPRLICPTK